MFVQNMVQAQNYERMTTGKHVHVMVRVRSMKNIHVYMYVPKCIQKCVYNRCYVCCIQIREVYYSCI